MRNVRKYYAIFGLLAALSLSTKGQDLAAEKIDDAATKAKFESAIDSYVASRREIETRLPALPTEATPEQITAHKALLLQNLRETRNMAKRGDIFTPEAEALIARIIKETYSEEELAKLRLESVQAETKGVPLKVNAAYPESKERLEMPPRLLLVLPELPDEVNYRFVGRHLLLLDKDSTLILDFMPNAIP
jgi:hypothetical protein